MVQKEKLVSAQVVLRAASGIAPKDSAAITAANVAQYLPSPEAVQKATAAFAAEGLQVAPVVGNSFSITGTAGAFERIFKTTLRARTGGGIEAVGPGDTGSEELPCDALPKEVARHVAAVTFSRPPAFGPGNL